MRVSVLFILIFSFLKGTSTEITGHNEEYAGRKLRFFRYSDPVTREKVHVFTLDIDATGSFKANVEVENTTFVFSEFGIYKGNLFLEPGQNFELLLPPLRQKSFAESKNPYFNPVEFWFATRDGTRLNDKVSAVDDLMNQLTAKYFNQLYFGQSGSAFDSLQTALQTQFPDEDSKILTQHKNLMLKAVEADAFRLPAAKITPAMMKSDPAIWTQPAFMQLFEKTFAGKLSFEVKSSQGNTIRKAIAESNASYFSSFIKDNYGITGALSDLVLLKMLHDAYYSGEFNQEAILNLLNNRHFSANRDQTIREFTNNVIHKLNHLRTGSKAPVICLKDINGNNKCTSESNSKFKYLLFADTEMIVVREQLKYLTRINEMFAEHLEIIVVLLKTDIIEMKRFLVEENIPGIHLVDENSAYIEKYRVKSYPACYLLNSSHEVVFQNTKAPLDGFEQQFGTYLRNELFMQQRNQSR